MTGLMMMVGALPACGWLGEPSPGRLAREATIEPTPADADGSGLILAAPDRLGRVAFLGDSVVWSVPEAILTVGRRGGPATVQARLPADCWAKSLVAAHDALYVTCGAQVLRVEGDGTVEPVLEGDFVYGLAAGHRGVYTCRDTRLVRIAAGGTYETLADLGVVPHPLGGPSAAACVGAEIAIGETQVFVRHAAYVWAVPRGGGAPAVVGQGSRILAFGDRLLVVWPHEGRSTWMEGEIPLLVTGLEGPCGTVRDGYLYSCVRRDGGGTDIVRLRLPDSPGAPSATPEVVARAEGPIEDLDVADDLILWADGAAPEGGRIRWSRTRTPETVH